MWTRRRNFAGVLAHELAHVTQRHVASRLERAQYLTLGALLVAVAGVAWPDQLAEPRPLAQAAQARPPCSITAVLMKAKPTILACNTLWQRLLRHPAWLAASRSCARKSWMSGVSIPTYLSTHPCNRRQGQQHGGKNSDHAQKCMSIEKWTIAASRGCKPCSGPVICHPQAAMQRFSGKDSLSLMGRGHCALQAKQGQRSSLPPLMRLFSKSPNDPLVLRKRAAFTIAKGNMNEAEKLLQKAIKLDRRDYMAAFYHARLLDETGRASQAPHYYQQVLLQVPREADVHEAYARSLGKAGNNYEAYIHLTYAAMYANNKKLAERHFKRQKAWPKKDRTGPN